MMWCEQNRRSWSPSVRRLGLSVYGVVTSEVACPFTRILNSLYIRDACHVWSTASMPRWGRSDGPCGALGSSNSGENR
jgi:hypothetical protein